MGEIPIIDSRKRAQASTGVAEEPPATKAVFVKTFGCQMNVYDSDRMMEALARKATA